MSEFDFRSFSPFIEDSKITDINYNGHELWLDHLEKGRYSLEDFYMDEKLEQFCYRFANYANLPFNATYPILESENEDLRVSIIHDSVARSGHSISIRKTPTVVRLTRERMLEQKYATASLLDFLERVVRARCNILVCGLPGAGKTELVKYMTSFIPSHERVITIEDTLELHYSKVHPYKDCVELKVNSGFDYVDAIKACLRQRPDWLLVSEVRSHEVQQMLEAISTGAKAMSTLHCDDASAIPMRLLHMFPGMELSNERILDMIYENIDIGIHVASTITPNGIVRAIEKVVCYQIKGDKRETIVLYENGKMGKEIPDKLVDKFKRYELKEKKKEVKRKEEKKLEPKRRLKKISDKD